MHQQSQKAQTIHEILVIQVLQHECNKMYMSTSLKISSTVTDQPITGLILEQRWISNHREEKDFEIEILYGNK